MFFFISLFPTKKNPPSLPGGGGGPPRSILCSLFFYSKVFVFLQEFIFCVPLQYFSDEYFAFPFRMNNMSSFSLGVYIYFFVSFCCEYYAFPFLMGEYFVISFFRGEYFVFHLDDRKAPAIHQRIWSRKGGSHPNHPDHCSHIQHP